MLLWALRDGESYVGIKSYTQVKDLPSGLDMSLNDGLGAMALSRKPLLG
jgi:hypothetical protein